MPTATVTSKRQITLPAEMCRKLRIVPGTKIDFVINAAGETVLRPKTGDIRALRGIVKHDGPPLSIEDMDRAVREAVVARYKRSFE
jgi:AbrB family looped-hinge helix DNA binding protein